MIDQATINRARKPQVGDVWYDGRAKLRTMRVVKVGADVVVCANGDDDRLTCSIPLPSFAEMVKKSLANGATFTPAPPPTAAAARVRCGASQPNAK